MEIDNKKKTYEFSIRTDLAIEAREMITKENDNDEIDGIEVKIQEDKNSDITVTWVKITNENGVKSMGKPIGNYITIESDSMKLNDVETHEKIIDTLSQNLIKLMNLKKDSLVLVVGLGNWNVTPDALGPKVISKILVTRNITGSLPEQIDESVRPVSAISPGVMGITGIETGEIVKGISERIKPDIIIAIDALAARRSNRINATIQISDTGISPGAGVGNKRMSLDEKTIGVPVIAIGVPTVVDAATLVNDTMDMMLDAMISHSGENSGFYDMLQNLDKEEKYGLITEILNPYVGNMFVTPKEVDAVIDRLSNIISNSINIAIHPGIDFNDINRYIN